MILNAYRLDSKGPPSDNQNVIGINDSVLGEGRVRGRKQAHHNGNTEKRSS